MLRRSRSIQVFFFCFFCVFSFRYDAFNTCLTSGKRLSHPRRRNRSTFSLTVFYIIR